jgi:hypothetical protein
VVKGPASSFEHSPDCRKFSQRQLRSSRKRSISVPNRGAIASKGVNVTPGNQEHAHMLRDGARKGNAKPESVTEGGASGNTGQKKGIGIFDVLECRTGCRRMNGMKYEDFPVGRKGAVQ